MNILCRLTILIFILTSLSYNADAQKKRTKKTNKGEQVEVKLKNGNVLVGELVKYSQDSLVIRNEQFGRIAFAQDEIKKYSGLSGISEDGDDGIGWNKSKYQSQYFLSPSARPVGKGNKYYTNFDIFANTFAFGLSDNFSLSVGFESVSLLAGSIPIIYLNPKFSIPVSENVYIGVGTSVFVATFDGNGGVGALSYGNITLGSATSNITLGTGYAFSIGDSFGEPLLQIGFTYPISKKVSILGEGFFTTSADGVYNIGLRIITKSNILFDVGISRATEFGNDLIGIPLLSLSIPF